MRRDDVRVRGAAGWIAGGWITVGLTLSLAPTEIDFAVGYAVGITVVLTSAFAIRWVAG